MSDLLVDAQSLQDVLSDPDCIVFDVRYSLADPEAGEQQYLHEHIPGAYFLDQGAHLAGSCTGKNGRHPLPDRHRLEQILQTHGVMPHSKIVVYDHNDGSFAARAWWVLRWLGYTQVSILDGGLKAWRDAGGSVQTSPGPDTADTRSGSQQGGHQTSTAAATMPTVSASDILALASDRGVTIVDARTLERYRGDAEPIDPVAGRIPGAINRPIASNVQADGRFKPAQQLRAEFQSLLGDRNSDQVIHYCGSGITACHNVFAMEVAGLSGAALYPGSWSEWCSDADRPVATG